jgi:hypothetical protein
MNKNQQRVAKLPFPGIEGAYVLISGSKRDMKDISGFYCKGHMTFAFHVGRTLAEWEPEYGPIQVWEQAKEKKEGTKEHYFFDYVYDTFGNWSQIAVDEAELPQAFVAGDYKYIFNVLKDWAENQEGDWHEREA